MQGFRVLQPSRSAQKHAQPTCIFATVVSSRRSRWARRASAVLIVSSHGGRVCCSRSCLQAGQEALVLAALMQICKQAAASPWGFAVCLGAGYGHDLHHVQHTSGLSWLWQKSHMRLAAGISPSRHTGHTVAGHLIMSGHSGMLQLVEFCPNRKT